LKIGNVVAPTGFTLFFKLKKDNQPLLKVKSTIKIGINYETKNVSKQFIVFLYD
jgi:hypothetical protein